MKIGLAGYQGAGKSTLFEWLTGVAADPALAHVGQSAMATVPESRVAGLCGVYHPKKVTQAALELVDTPGLARDHSGNAARLAVLRESGCLVLVVAGYNQADSQADLARFREDLLLADLEIVSGRVDRLRESTKKPKPTRDQELAELAALTPVLAALEAGTNLDAVGMTEEQQKATRSFRLFSEKPTLVLINAADDESDLDRFTRAADPPTLAVRGRLELDLARLAPLERSAFEQDLGVGPSRRDLVLRTMLDVSGQMIFFTASEKEVRTWMLRRGGTAIEAAAGIHTDLARGFIRAEVMPCDDLIRLGSEREVKAHHLMRQEPRDYVIRDGDIVHIRFSV
jgi:hypothetical protein